MKCPKCGNELKEGMLFCEHCGEEIRIVQDFEPEMDMDMEAFSTENFSGETFSAEDYAAGTADSGEERISTEDSGAEPFLKK